MPNDNGNGPDHDRRKRPRMDGPAMGAADDDDGIAALMEWATTNGANVNRIRITSTATGDADALERGAVSAAELAPGDVIASLPANLILSESVAAASAFGKRLDAHMRRSPDTIRSLCSGLDPYAPSLIFFSAFLAHERFCNGPKSFWWPYLVTLPEKFDLPVSWSDDEIDEHLRGTNLVYIVKERRRMLQVGGELVNGALQAQDAAVEGSCLEEGSGECTSESHASWTLDYDMLLWAYSAVSSRAFPQTRRTRLAAAASYEPVSELCLYPVLDMLNHRRDERIEWRTTLSESADSAITNETASTVAPARPRGEGKKAQGPIIHDTTAATDDVSKQSGITFITPHQIPKGVVVYNNYGTKGNENLLSNYAFCLDPNPEDYYKISLAIRPDDPLASRRSALMSALQVSSTHLLFGDDKLDEEFLKAGRIAVANARELAGLEECFPVPLRLEIATAVTLSALIRQKLSLLPPPPSIKSEELTNRCRLARVYVEGQRRIMRHQLGLLRAHQEGLVNGSAKVLHPDSQSRRRGPFDEIVDSVEGGVDEIWDPETKLAVMVAFEDTRVDDGHGGLWELGAKFRSLKREELEDLLGPGGVDAVVETFEEVVEPVLSAVGVQGFNVDDFIVAACVVQEYSVEFNSGDGMPVLGVVMP